MGGMLVCRVPAGAFLDKSVAEENKLHGGDRGGGEGGDRVALFGGDRTDIYTAVCLYFIHSVV